jgi:hypothetical protein
VDGYGPVQEGAGAERRRGPGTEAGKAAQGPKTGLPGGEPEGQEEVGAADVRQVQDLGLGQKGAGGVMGLGGYLGVSSVARANPGGRAF